MVQPKTGTITGKRFERQLWHARYFAVPNSEKKTNKTKYIE